MRMSRDGRLFVIRYEGEEGVSNYLYHPSESSGVTIGAGYDMKARPPAEVMKHLTQVGVDPGTAAKAAQGAQLSGSAADNFVKSNKTLLYLSDIQQAGLLELVPIDWTVWRPV